jgi:glycosyltransferase involved in cell wall biosynthesis
LTTTSESRTEAQPSGEWKPLVSVVIEGYNEIQLATSMTDVLDGLAKQDYPLDRMELILVGQEEEQYRKWSGLQGEALPFRRLVTVDAEGAPYYVLKNKGAERAAGEIIAFIDSDVYPDPGWVSAIVAAIESGADATAGVSMFRDRTAFRTPRPILQTAASVSFGHVVGEDPETKAPAAWAIVAHNVAFRADVFREHSFDTTLGRNCSIGLLHETLRRNGKRIDLVPGQRVEHSFSAKWFLYPFHIRVGWEEYALRRRNPNDPNRWLMRAGPLEPVANMLFFVAVDSRTWFRYSRQISLGPVGRWARLPALLAVSTAARAAGAVGMYAAMLRPEQSLAWAEAQ